MGNDNIELSLKTIRLAFFLREFKTKKEINNPGWPKFVEVNVTLC